MRDRWLLVALYVVVIGVGLQAQHNSFVSADPASPTRSRVHPQGATHGAAAGLPDAGVARILESLAAQRRQVEQELAADAGKFARADLLAMYGRSAAAGSRPCRR